MLPFLKLNKEGSASGDIEKMERKPDEGKKEEINYLETAAEEVLEAIKKNDSKALAVALKAAFELCDSYPHEEGEHI